MIIIETTCIKGRFNLVNTSKLMSNDDRYIRQLSRKDVLDLGKSILDLVSHD